MTDNINQNPRVRIDQMLVDAIDATKSKKTDNRPLDVQGGSEALENPKLFAKASLKKKYLKANF